MNFKDNDLISGGKISILSPHSGGNIQDNPYLKKNIFSDNGFDLIIKSAQMGTPLVELGKGRPKVMVVAGVHGNELPPQIAALNLMEHIKNMSLWGTVYLIPFAAPGATMENTRWFKGSDLNRASSSEGSITNMILKFIQMLNLDAVADFHSTKPKSNPGRESVFCTKKPCINSYNIAQYITKKTSSELICYDEAGSMYKGALEDECNLRNIPSVTCEVVSENGKINPGSIERSFLQMKMFLKHFKILR